MIHIISENLDDVLCSEPSVSWRDKALTLAAAEATGDGEVCCVCRAEYLGEA
jgi:hypothetical protein